MRHRKRGKRIPVVGDARNSFFININLIAPTFGRAMDERVNTPLKIPELREKLQS